MSDRQFPPVSAEALDGSRFVAPRDFADGRSVAVVGFGLEQRSEIESWGAELSALATAGTPARLFPALDSGNGFMRGMVTAGLKAALPAKELRAATIPLFTDVDAFCAALGIIDRTHVAVLVLDTTGRVVWHGSGPATAPLSAALHAALSG